MGWSYSNSPQKSDRDAVRLLVGDTDSADKLLSNEEIEYFLAQEGSVSRAARLAVTTLIAKFSRLADESVGQVKVNFSKRVENLMSLSKELEKRAAVVGVEWIAGGITHTDKAKSADDPDIVQPFFDRELHNKRSPTGGESGGDPKFIEKESTVEANTISVPSGATQIEVLLAFPQVSADYIIHAQWENSVDPSPQFQNIVVIDKQNDRFTLAWNSELLTSNYKISYSIEEKRV
jgi:hypothetical protein